MNNISHFFQKYQQASWRVQLQWLVLFVLGVVAVALVAALYLSVSARATQTGREIQSLEAAISSGERVNADLESQMAEVTSIQAMKERAIALGFQPVDPTEITYVRVSGYEPPSAINMASQETQPSASVISPEYTQSLFDWFIEKMQSTP
jgi:cell division protein FtsL